MIPVILPSESLTYLLNKFCVTHLQIMIRKYLFQHTKNPKKRTNYYDRHTYS
jgi:hypothetical protein